MRKLLGIGAALAVLTLAAAPGARAATEVGDTCEANTSLITGIEGIAFPLGDGASVLPASVPAAGIATRWTVHTAGPGGFSSRLKVVRLVPGGNEIEIVAETPLAAPRKGSFVPTRIPVQAGDRFGLSGPAGAMVCAGGGGVAGLTTANGPPGTREQFFESSGYRPAVAVTVEPDADGDGYGDESQDGCPSDATIQKTGCPRVKLSHRAELRERAILVWVGVDKEARVGVLGAVRWRVRQPSGKKVTLIQAIGNNRERTLQPGPRSRFRLALGKTVLRRLGRIEPRQHLNAQLTVLATDAVGTVSQERFKLRLPGRGYPPSARSTLIATLRG